MFSLKKIQPFIEVYEKKPPLFHEGDLVFINVEELKALEKEMARDERFVYLKALAESQNSVVIVKTMFLLNKESYIYLESCWTVGRRNENALFYLHEMRLYGEYGGK